MECKIINNIMTKICPKCGHEYFEHSALSRVDDSEICPECGMLESLEAAGWSAAEKEEGMRLAKEMMKKAYLQQY